MARVEILGSSEPITATIPTAGNVAPTQAPMAPAAKPMINGNTATVVDSKGRRITVKKLTPLNKLRLYAIAGDELSRNEAWFTTAALTWSVTHIADEPVFQNSLREMESVLERLDEPGLDAAANGFASLIGPVEDTKEVARNL
jgi:hypothetical protein